MTLVVLTADDGSIGLGWTEDGAVAARSIIDRHLARPLFQGEPAVDRATACPSGRPGLGVTLDRERLRELTAR
jgi:L-alanine-DL-glutamate epimerase-like enolase superfamily enzyme